MADGVRAVWGTEKFLEMVIGGNWFGPGLDRPLTLDNFDIDRFLLGPFPYCQIARSLTKFWFLQLTDPTSGTDSWLKKDKEI